MLVDAIVASVVILIVGLVIGYLLYFDPRRVAVRALRGPRIDIAAAGPGRAAKVVGVARSGGASALTLGGERCLFVQTSLHHFYRRSRSGAVSESWKPVAEEARGGAFELVDSTGAVVVIPAGASWHVNEQWMDIDWGALSPSLAEFIARHGAVQHGSPAKIQEIVVREGQRLSVFGTPMASADNGIEAFAAGKGQLLAVGEPTE